MSATDSVPGDRPIELLVVSALFPPLHTGAGLQAASLLRQLAGSVRVRILTLGAPGQPRVEERDGWIIERIGSIVSRRPARSFGLAVLRRLPSLRDRPDLIWCLGVGPATYAAIMIGRARGIPVLVKLTLEGQDDPASLRSRTAGALRLRLLRKAALVCPSERLRQIALDAGFEQDRVHCIPNGVDLERFAPRTPRHQGQIVFLGIIAERKGLHLVVEAMRELAEEHPAARLLILGEANPAASSREVEYGRQLRVEIESPPLSSRIEMMGRLEHPEEVLGESSIFVLPSLAEGLPNALLEAMAAGAVPVVSGLSSVREVVTDGVDGLLVQERTSQAWAQALRSLLCDPGAVERMGRAARVKVEQRFGLSAIARSYQRLFRDLTEADRRRGSDGRPV